MTEAWVRNWGVRDGCSGAMLTRKPCLAQKLREKPEPKELNSCMCVLCIPFQYCSAKCFRIRCSVRYLMEREGDRREGRKLLCHFPFSVCPPAPRGETCVYLLPQVLCSARHGSTGYSSGSGWLWLMPMQRRPRLVLMCCVMSSQRWWCIGELLPLQWIWGHWMKRGRASSGCVTCSVNV